LKNQIFKGQEKRVSVVHDGGVSHVDDYVTSDSVWPAYTVCNVSYTNAFCEPLWLEHFCQED